jgi:hypothetical protein
MTFSALAPPKASHDRCHRCCSRRLKIDPVIRERLGDQLLTELTVIAERAGVAEATLHHAECQDSRWELVDHLPRFVRSPSWRSGGFAFPDTGLLVCMVNPTCEAALLAATERGWRLGSLDVFLQAGMQTGSLDPLPMPSGFTAAHVAGTLTVSYEADGAPLARWWLPSDVGVNEAPTGEQAEIS